MKKFAVKIWSSFLEDAKLIPEGWLFSHAIDRALESPIASSFDGVASSFKIIRVSTSLEILKNQRLIF